MDILIVEDHEPTRSRLISMLDGQSDYRVMGAVDSSEKAAEMLSSRQPDLIIHDLGLPGLSGPEAIRKAKALCPASEILVFTIMDEDEQVFAALKAGASGYILKDAKPLELIAAIEELKSGGSPMSFPIARKVLREFQGLKKQEELQDVCSPLSRREAELLELMYQGDGYKEIAGKLCISLHTVHSHIKNIYAKLHVNSRAQAVFEACRQKLIKPKNT